MRWSSATALAMYPAPAQMPTAMMRKSRVAVVLPERGDGGTDVASLALGLFELAWIAFALAERSVVEGQCREAPCSQRPRVCARRLFLDRSQRSRGDDSRYRLDRGQIQHSDQAVSVACKGERFARRSAHRREQHDYRPIDSN